MKGAYLALALGLFTGSALAAERVIHFGTSATYPPFEFVDGNNQVAGFDIDIARAVCKELQATCSFTNQSFDRLI
ncbi:transporter substrate-binding domain-containing protein, partial [Escherichia coli]|uniref:transporter substrate-binding domain-containing protein n=1 Tax=Escherichia coli TaxID=562 RepID=UPI003F56FA19